MTNFRPYTCPACLEADVELFDGFINCPLCGEACEELPQTPNPKELPMSNTANTKMTNAQLHEVIVALTARVEALELAEESRVRPATAPSRKMTELDAYRVRYGDLMLTPPKTAAKILGLSAGQIYSVKGDYTFNQVTKDRTELKEAMEALLAQQAEIEANAVETSEATDEAASE